jgi:hypothetical protein
VSTCNILLAIYNASLIPTLLSFSFYSFFYYSFSWVMARQYRPPRSRIQGIVITKWISLQDLTLFYCRLPTLPPTLVILTRLVILYSFCPTKALFSAVDPHHRCRMPFWWSARSKASRRLSELLTCSVSTLRVEALYAGGCFLLDI